MQSNFSHEHPEYAHKADLEALEGRIINRIGELEVRLVRDINTAFWRQALAFGGILIAIVALLATVLFFVINSLSSQIGRLEQLTR
jgi:hypothetical protein